jgi:hypothetical protein
VGSEHDRVRVKHERPVDDDRRWVSRFGFVANTTVAQTRGPNRLTHTRDRLPLSNRLVIERPGSVCLDRRERRRHMKDGEAPPTPMHDRVRVAQQFHGAIGQVEGAQNAFHRYAALILDSMALTDCLNSAMRASMSAFARPNAMSPAVLSSATF